MNVELKKEKKLLWVQPAQQSPQLLSEILEASSFSGCHAQVGSESIPPDLDSLLDKIEESHFVADFHLYDEHMIVFSEIVTVEEITVAAHHVGKELGFEVVEE